MRNWFIALCIGVLASDVPAIADETPKHGGTLTFMIPADAPPSFDGHRENTFATIHAVAPFYSVLIRANPDNPADTTHFVCDVCVKIPRPTDDGKTYTFLIRDDIKFSDGTPLTARDVAASWNKIVNPPEGVISVRRALTLAIDRWHGAEPMSRITVSRTVGGIVFPGSPLAATRAELQDIAGYWPDIEKSRAEARRLLHEAGADGLTFELLNRNVDQPYKFNGIWVVDEWSKIGVHATQRVLPTGPYVEALRHGDFAVAIDAECQNVVNPLLDGTKYLPHSVSDANYGNYDDPEEIALYDQMLRETDFARQRALMRQFEKRVLDTEAHEAFLLWRYRIVPYRSYVKGFRISPSHYVNQDLATIWLDK